jgi:hypothetical protein
MKPSHKEVEPDFKASAKFFRNGSLISEMPCSIWLPRHRHERPYLTFESTDQQNEIIGQLSPFYDLTITFDGFGERSTEIFAERVCIEKFRTTHSSPHLPPIITCEGHPEIFVKKEILTTTELSPGKNKLCTLKLTDNFLLSPTCTTLSSYTGNVEVNPIHSHIASIQNVGKIQFEKHFYQISLNDAGTASYSGLVATIELESEFEPFDDLKQAIYPQVRDYLLLSSFASNQFTKIVSMSAYVDNTLWDIWYSNISVSKPNKERKHSHHDVLIDKSSFDEFMKTISPTFTSFKPDKKELIRQAIYRIIPSEDSVLESKFLNCFSALESVVLIFRKESNLEFTIAENKKWKKLEKSLRSCILENEDLFETTSHRDLLKEMIPSLRRVSLKSAFDSFISTSGLDISDLWPVFGSKHETTLNNVRNRLIHGDPYKSNQHGSLWRALINLEFITTRAILTVLGWDASKSNVSKKHIVSNGWVGNSQLQNDMQVLSENKTD